MSYKYEPIRLAARIATTTIYTKEKPDWEGHLRLTSIDSVALDYLDQNWAWDSNPDMFVGTAQSWRFTCNKFKKSSPRFIDLAIWFDSELAVLMLGNISKGKVEISLNFIEGNFDVACLLALQGYRLKICVTYATLIAQHFRAERVVVKSPLKTAIPFYESIGFTKPTGHRRKRDILELVLEYEKDNLV